MDWVIKSLRLGFDIPFKDRLTKVLKVIISIAILVSVLGIMFFSLSINKIWTKNQTIYENKSDSEKIVYNEGKLAQNPQQLIRFHVLANSDSDQDQALKRAVRDAILKEVSPKLAVSKSLKESRQIIERVRPEMERIGRSVVKAWGKDYSVHTEYGHFSFPTKSYGTLILPAGDYEALRIVIGKGKGSNWWCVLFPPLCFIDIEHSTAVQVDGKPGIPISNDTSPYSDKQKTKKCECTR